MMTKPVSQWGIEDLQALVGQQEGQGLEFKASPSLSNTDGNVRELVKDVTAMANAAGGVIIYGIEESKAGFALGLDDGTDQKPEWIEQVLATNIEPRLTGIGVHRIPLDTGRSVYAVEVPAASTLAPHQSRKDQRYHRRHGRTVLAMYDHEVRDLMRRGSAPEVYLRWIVTPRAGDVFEVRVLMGNNGDEPVMYGRAELVFDNELNAPAQVERFRVEPSVFVVDGVEHPARRYTKNHTVNASLPIFRGQEWDLWRAEVTILPGIQYFVGTRFACPGFTQAQAGIIGRIGTEAPFVSLKTFGPAGEATQPAEETPPVSS